MAVHEAQIRLEKYFFFLCLMLAIEKINEKYEKKDHG